MRADTCACIGRDDDAKLEVRSPIVFAMMRTVPVKASAVGHGGANAASPPVFVVAEVAAGAVVGRVVVATAPSPGGLLGPATAGGQLPSCCAAGGWRTASRANTACSIPCISPIMRSDASRRCCTSSCQAEAVVELAASGATNGAASGAAARPCLGARSGTATALRVLGRPGLLAGASLPADDLALLVGGMLQLGRACYVIMPVVAVAAIC